MLYSLSKWNEKYQSETIQHQFPINSLIKACIVPVCWKCAFATTPSCPSWWHTPQWRVCRLGLRQLIPHWLKLNFLKITLMIAYKWNGFSSCLFPLRLSGPHAGRYFDWTCLCEHLWRKLKDWIFNIKIKFWLASPVFLTPNNAFWEAGLQPFRLVLVEVVPFQTNLRQHPVSGGRNRREFCMVPANSLHTMASGKVKILNKFNLNSPGLNLLAWSHFCQNDVIVNQARQIIRKTGLLVANWNPFEALN